MVNSTSGVQYTDARQFTLTKNGLINKRKYQNDNISTVFKG